MSDAMMKRLLHRDEQPGGELGKQLDALHAEASKKNLAHCCECLEEENRRLREERARDCEHGQLARSCHTCELESELRTVREERDWLLTLCERLSEELEESRQRAADRDQIQVARDRFAAENARLHAELESAQSTLRSIVTDYDSEMYANLSPADMLVLFRDRAMAELAEQPQPDAAQKGGE